MFLMMMPPPAPITPYARRRLLPSLPQVGSTHLARHHLYDHTPQTPDVGRTPVTFPFCSSDDFWSHVCCKSHRWGGGGGEGWTNGLSAQHPSELSSIPSPHRQDRSMFRG